MRKQVAVAILLATVTAVIVFRTLRGKENALPIKAPGQRLHALFRTNESLSFSNMYYMSGRVKKTGFFYHDFSRPLTLSQAVSSAQGFLEDASTNRIFLMGGGRKGLVVDYAAAMTNASYNSPILPGTRVHVPKR